MVHCTVQCIVHCTTRVTLHQVLTNTTAYLYYCHKCVVALSLLITSVTILVQCVFAVNTLRVKYLGMRPRLRVVEAVLLSFVVFATLFCLATNHPCRPCPKAGQPTVGAHVLSYGEEG